MASRDKKFFPRLPSLSARFHIAFGLTSLITSLTLASVFSGLVPDRQSIKAANQIMMAEALATSSSMLLRRSDMSGISTSLEFIVNRNDDLEYVELLRHNDKNTVRFASSAQDLAEDPGIADSVDGESQGNFEVVMNSAPITVPLMRGNREWGELRFGFKSVKPTGWRAYIPKEPYGLLLFMSLLSFPLFYLYLGRMLKELNPSAAVPSRVRSALDTIAESLLVIDRRGNVVLANEAFAELAGREAESLIGMHAKDLAWVHNDDQNPEYPWMQAFRCKRQGWWRTDEYG